MASNERGQPNGSMNTQHYQVKTSPLHAGSKQRLHIEKKGCLPPVRKTTGNINLSELEDNWDRGIDPVPMNHNKSPAGSGLKTGRILNERNLSCVNMPGGYRGKKKRAIIR